MNKTEKGATIEALKDKINESSFFYLADASSMTVAQINSFRRICHEKGIEVKVKHYQLTKVMPICMRLCTALPPCYLQMLEMHQQR